MRAVHRLAPVLVLAVGASGVIALTVGARADADPAAAPLSVRIGDGSTGAQILPGGQTVTQRMTRSGIVVVSVAGRDGDTATASGVVGDVLKVSTKGNALGGSTEVSMTSSGNPLTVSEMGRSPIVAAVAAGMPYERAVAEFSSMLGPRESVPTKAAVETALASPDDSAADRGE